jgi:hypothetical protein
MDFQIISVGTIIFLALAYIGFNVWRKVKSFSAKSSCAAGCDCAAKPDKTAKA